MGKDHGFALYQQRRLMPATQRAAVPERRAQGPEHEPQARLAAGGDGARRQRQQPLQPAQKIMAQGTALGQRSNS